MGEEEKKKKNLARGGEEKEYESEYNKMAKRWRLLQDISMFEIFKLKKIPKQSKYVENGGKVILHDLYARMENARGCVFHFLYPNSIASYCRGKCFFFL